MKRKIRIFAEKDKKRVVAKEKSAPPSNLTYRFLLSHALATHTALLRNKKASQALLERLLSGEVPSRFELL